MKRKVGRPSLPPGTKRVMIAARVSPETAAILASERTATGLSLGALMDAAMACYIRPEPSALP